MLKFDRTEIYGELLKIDAREFKGRVFFTTDLHGHYDLLHEKLTSVAFDSSVDILILGGDCTDRGPDSKHVLDYLNEPWIHCIRGNHEELFISSFEEDWQGQATNCLISNGGFWVAELDEQSIQNIYESFKSLPLAIELITPRETISIIHAQCPYNDWNEFKKITKPELEYNGYAVAQWARRNYEKHIQVKGVDRLIVGHTPTESGEVEVWGNTWYADLGSFFRDKISFLQLM